LQSAKELTWKITLSLQFLLSIEIAEKGGKKGIKFSFCHKGKGNLKMQLIYFRAVFLKQASWHTDIVHGIETQKCSKVSEAPGVPKWFGDFALLLLNS